MNKPSYLLFKQCSKCGEIKHISRFYKVKNGKYGVEGACKECRKIHNKKYREEHKDYYEEYGKQYYEDNKDKLHLGDYDINNNETNKIDNKPIIAYNEDEGIEFEYSNYIIACEELECDKYYVKRSLLNKKTNIYSTSKVLDIKIYFKFK